MIITTGLFDNMVLQRTAKNISHALITGTCSQTGAITATVKRGTAAIKGFTAKRIGRTADGRFSIRLSGLPAGGPYTVTLSITDSKGSVQEKSTIKNIMVGDVWILAGQSNMEGIGYRRHALKPDAQVRAFYMNDVWATAKDPVHILADAVDRVHHDISGGTAGRPADHIGVGPGVSFAQQMRRVTKVPQGIIACAHGGTSMTQWDPALAKAGKESLYGAMLRRFVKNGSAVAGVFWYQGCSDTDQHSAPKYTARMTTLINAMRSDFCNARLPVVMVQIARVCGELNGQEHWNSVQEQQRVLPATVKHLAVVPAIDLDMDDSIHIAGYDQNRLGVRGANAMAVLSKRTAKGVLPIAFKSVRVERDSLSGTANVIITYQNCAGKLTAPGRPEGFTLTPVIGQMRHNYIYRTELGDNTVILKTIVTVIDAESMFLHYGFGRRPYCNICDSADQSLPVMGPVYLGGDKAFAPFITTLQVSAFQPSAGNLLTLPYPQNPQALEFKVRAFDGTFCNLHPEITECDMEDPLVYFRTTIRCSERMETILDLGYDGPLKVWVNGVQQLFDPNGINPALSGDAVLPVTLDAGDHEIMVALGSNKKRAWGVFLRLGRVGISVEQIKKGPGAYSVPVAL